MLDGPEGRTDKLMSKRTNKQTENLPILKDFVPCPGHCLAPPRENQEESERNGKKNLYLG